MCRYRWGEFAPLVELGQLLFPPGHLLMGRITAACRARWDPNPYFLNLQPHHGVYTQREQNLHREEFQPPEGGRACLVIYNGTPDLHVICLYLNLREFIC